MNRIILAYAPENAVLANTIDQSLSRIGIPFEHANGAVASQIAAAGEPVLLLVTDNFLVNKNCLDGLLPVLKALAAENKLVTVIADGQNDEGRPVPTHIDRMANVLHYMKHWQDTWLALSDQQQHLDADAKARASADLDATRYIANQVGDIISTLRDAGYSALEEFEANDFEAFFHKFNLQDWHGQYKRMASQARENADAADVSHLPEMPVSGGLLAPEPVLEEPPTHIAADHARVQTDQGLESGVVAETPVETTRPSTDSLNNEPLPDAGKIEQAAQDAWFWIENGHVQRGLELFQIALEQYPESSWLQAEFDRAALNANVDPAAQEAPVETHGTRPSPENTMEDVSPKLPSDEAKSYELMGELAVERGDYLFAKYCWDRVLEIAPNYPDIHRKLGLMTAEHLWDYKETASFHLRKALEINPHDPEVQAALEGGNQTKEPAPSAPVTIPILVEPLQPSAPDIAESPVQKEASPQLVLITGATSGIGRATAELFARNGYRLILTGRRVERLVELKNRLVEASKADILLLPFDVRDAGAVEAALSSLPDSFKDIDILVNNAGLAKGLAPIHEGNLEHWETMIDTNVKGLLYVSRLVSKGMVLRKQGHIINVCSSAGKEAYPNGNVYCATKFAVDALTKSMRFDLHAHNIRVSQVSPGHVEETEFAITRFDGDAERAKIYNDFQPLKSSDVADAIYFMATRPAHVNIQDLQMFATQQASSMVINRSGR